MKQYKIRVVSPKQFERVAQSNPRYEEVASQIEDVMGFANPEEGVGYVRNTHIKELNEYLVSHEFEHLVESSPTHSDSHGIRYKKGADIASTLVKVVSVIAAPVTGGLSLLAPVALDVGRGAARGDRGLGRTALKSYAGNVLGAGTGAAAGSALGLGQTATSALAGGTRKVGEAGGAKITGERAGRGLGRQALTGALTEGTTSAGLTSLGTGMGTTGGATAPGTTTPGITTPGAAIPSAQPAIPSAPTSPTLAPASVPSSTSGGVSSRLTSGLQVTGRLANQILGGGGGSPGVMGIPPQPTASPAPTQTSANTQALGGTVQPQQGVFNKIQSSLGLGTGDLARLALTAGTLGFGETQGPSTPQAPDLSSIPSVAQLRDTAGQPQSPLGELGQGALSERLTTPYAGLQENVRSAITQPFSRLREQTASQFRQFRPDADLATDSAFRQAMADVDRQEADAVAIAEQRELERFSGQRTQDISSALGVDSQTLNTLTQIAQLDVDQIMIQLGIDSADAQAFKERFGNIAALIAGSGGQQGGVNINIGGTP